MMKLVVLSLALATGSATFFTNQTEVQKVMFSNFKKEHGRVYESVEEEAKRFEIFVENLKIIDERNAAEAAVGGSGQHGINKFADVSQEEFKARYLTTVVPEELLKKPKLSLKPVERGSSKDWTGTYTTPVKDQGYCGSCWAFSVTEQLESDSMRQLGTDYVLAPQQLVSCDTNDSGCNGGWPTNAYEYIESIGGMVQETDYPYTSGTSGSTGTCSTSSTTDKVLTVSNYYTLSGESSMASHVVKTGPVAIAVDASSWSSYTGGILSSCGSSIDHAVQAVGVDTSSYWKVRNSWGTSWGESGFIRLAYGQDTCSLSYIPTYVDAAEA